LDAISQLDAILQLMEKDYSSFLTPESVPVDSVIVIFDTYSEILLMRSIAI
jgi:hypothetical protein